VNEPSVDPARFRQAIARWATGVSIVTAREGEADFGLTVNSLTSIALDPPLLLVSLSTLADTTAILARVGAFGVSLLSAEQRAISERFARPTPAPPKFEGLAVHRGVTGAALLDDALATFECRVEAEHAHADHRLFVGRVVAAHPGREAVPLIFYRSRYAPAEGLPGLAVSPPGRP
jgi:flavin reductase (DIM6/NTAB) family NADH-FMN oxidoreductase RutF